MLSALEIFLVMRYINLLFIYLLTKHSNFVDVDTAGAKKGTKYLELLLESFKVTHFGIAEKPTRACVLYNNVRFRVGNFEGKV